MRRRKLLKSPVKFVCIIVSVAFIIIQIISVLHIGNISQSTFSLRKPKSPNRNLSKIGEFGEMVIGMLPEDLAFTLFLPSEEAIRRDLRLNRNDSISYAILTRILGFSAVPRWIFAAELEYGKQILYDSISGFSLNIWKDSTGMVVVNGVVSEQVDLKIGKILVHVVDGVVMDAEFAESVITNEEDDDGD